MRTLTLILFIVFACQSIAGCGGAQSVEDAGLNPALADDALTVAGCPSGMALAAAQPGRAPACIDTSARAAAQYGVAGDTCKFPNGYHICSLSELIQGSSAGVIGSGAYWSSDLTSGGTPAMFIGNTVTGTGLATNNLRSYYCCSR